MTRSPEAAAALLRSYTVPKLVRFGLVADMTRSGTSSVGEAGLPRSRKKAN